MEASYVEIYQEKIRDLLRPGSSHSDSHAIQNAPPGGCPLVLGVQREPITSVDAAAGLVRRAAAARAVEATHMNATSSRSHTLFMLYITGVHEAAGKKLEGCLNLVRGMVYCVFLSLGTALQLIGECGNFLTPATFLHLHPGLINPPQPGCIEGHRKIITKPTCRVVHCLLRWTWLARSARSARVRRASA